MPLLKTLQQFPVDPLRINFKILGLPWKGWQDGLNPLSQPTLVSPVLRTSCLRFCLVPETSQETRPS